MPEDFLTFAQLRIKRWLQFSVLDATQRSALQELLDGLEYSYAIHYALDRLENECAVNTAKVSKQALKKKPSVAQIELLNGLHYEGPKPVYMSEASLLIDRIKKHGLGYC